MTQLASTYDAALQRSLRVASLLQAAADDIKPIVENLLMDLYDAECLYTGDRRELAYRAVDECLRVIVRSNMVDLPDFESAYLPVVRS